MKQLFIKLWRFILDGVFPAHCLECGIEGNFLCSVCEKSLSKLQNQICPWCYKPNPAGKPCYECIHPERFLDGVVACSRFAEHSLLQKAVHHLKYDFIKDLSTPLGSFLTGTFLGSIRNSQENFILCPVPLHPKRQRWRGFNQSELLCAAIIQKLHRDGHKNVQMLQLLERVHFSKPQMELKKEDRIKNVEGAFRICERIMKEPEQSFGRIKNSTVVLVDDVATTLSTLNSAAHALKKAGFGRVYGLVLARVF